ncbi:hypothetical protein SCLARK_00251 [Spiroplasma clarkii]|uniref:Lipoprotein n=1 Tax=Spiroplasma clarkii TaxID=2139 RepID=A0A1Y0KZ60_9MOLU|nr:hypothetical protein [Spiroplasma clarkii]ARU91011.1 hypothetical protein SCLARK_00251 [Spiroplasma clarkii]ATX70454.1 hypothetical protein SCLAR_v1c01230 [Spiroplasma clarkii]
MKNLIKIAASLGLTAPLGMSVVACGGKSNVITYSYVNNGTDKDASKMFADLEQKYYEIYGTKYKLEGKAYQDENQLPEDIMTVGNASAPDVFAANVDAAAKLATNNAILALEGADSPQGADQILKNLNYNEDYANQKLTAFKADDGASMSSSDKWGAWLPYAVKASKIKSNNASSNETKAVQYGITKHLGVGGGTAVVSTSEKSIATFNAMGMLNSITLKPDGGIDWKANADGFSIKQLATWSAESENSYVPFLIDRGMWWMYPVYANIVSDPISGTVYKAADIGMNWVNDSSLPYYDTNDGKYSSVWTNKYFTTSAREVVGKWFELFAQQFKVAKNKLAGTGQISELPENLLDPSQNAAVQANMIDNEIAGGVNYEPGSYFDMLKGFREFAKMDYVGLDHLKLWSEADSADLYNKYESQGVNKWLSPAGSGMMVFNARLGSNAAKLRAAQQWVELMFGASEVKNEAGEQEIKFDDDGGVFNFKDQFSKLGDNPAKIAILDESLRETGEFKTALDSKVDVKYNRAINEDSEYKSWIGTDQNKIKNEKDAIFRLESISIRLAASLYGSENATLSWAPNVSSYDTATDNDWHGNNAMKPSLTAALVTGVASDAAFQDVFGFFSDKSLDWMNDTKFTSRRDKFVDDLIKSLADLNKNQSEQN